VTGATGTEGATGATGATGPTGNGTGAFAIFESFQAVPSGDCLSFAKGPGRGYGHCPGSAPTWSSSYLLAGPIPANGGTVSNLQVESNAWLTAQDRVLVAVIDNATGATPLSCTVDKTSKGSCSNTSVGGTAAAGHNIEVKVTAIGSSGNYKQWRVSFRI
jgi:hypothetical protein